MRRLPLLVICLLAAGIRAAAAPSIVAAREDAFIAHDAGSNRWTIGSAALSVDVSFDTSGALAIGDATMPSTERTWPLSATIAMTIDGQRAVVGNTGAMAFLGADAVPTDSAVQLAFRFEHRSSHVRITRTYQATPGTPTIELWTRVDGPSGAPVMLTDINSFDFTMPLATIRWLGGLRGESADNVMAGAFALDQRNLDPGERLEIGGDGRSTEQFVPFVMVDDGRDEFYGGLVWSGSWQIAFERVGERVKVNAYFPGVETNVAGRTLDVPHAFFGVKPRSASDESGTLHPFILNGLRHGRGLRPLVTYNTWYPYGSRVTEASVRDEMHRSAATGVELFVLDAGWYAGAGAMGYYDYTSGLGTWSADPERFPSGLAALADEAHAAGMKFGIWVEPERVSLDTVNRSGLARESWLATRDGSYGSSDSGQICLAHAAARRWVLDRLEALVEESHADYLKWDNNFWINCDRQDHGHGATDGNMAHVQGLYAVLAELRSRYPDLLIENAAGGGNRIDFGMLAYTDAAWMDDRSAPSEHVRHNLEGLTFAFPPAYLLSFVVNSDTESIAGSADPSTLVRSRMPGIIGLSYTWSGLPPEERDAIQTEIANYKLLREIIADANATLLSDQAPTSDGSWDVMQEVAHDGRSAILFAFAPTDDNARLLVRMRSLDASATYDIRSLDAGVLGSVAGSVIMSDGIEIVHEAGATRAHVLVLTAK